MPNPVYIQELEVVGEFIQADKATVLQTLQEVNYNGAPHMLKSPPANSNSRVQNIRILNEAIYGKAVEIFAKKMQDKSRAKIIEKVKADMPDISEAELAKTVKKSLERLVFVTPDHHLVLNTNKDIVGLLTSKVPYHYIGDFGTSRNDFIRFFSHPAMAMISGVRYVLGDLDSYNNIGYNTDNYQRFSSLSSIDYGLAGFSKLLELDVLFPDEKLKAPDDKSTFELRIENIVTSVLHRMTDVETLAHHAFGSSSDNYIAYISSTDPKSVKTYNTRLNTVYRDMISVMTAETFEQEVKQALGFAQISTQNKVYFNEIYSHLAQQINLLKEACSNLSLCSPSQIESFAAANEIDPATTKAVLSGSFGYSAAQANSIFSQRLTEEKQRAKEGQLSPAQGGNECSQILKPIARRPGQGFWHSMSSSPVSASSVPAKKDHRVKPVLSSSAPTR
jgi:hypothetical protein